MPRGAAKSIISLCYSQLLRVASSVGAAPRNPSVSITCVHFRCGVCIYFIFPSRTLNGLCICQSLHGRTHVKNFSFRAPKWVQRTRDLGNTLPLQNIRRVCSGAARTWTSGHVGCWFNSQNMSLKSHHAMLIFISSLSYFTHLRWYHKMLELSIA